MRSTWIEQLGFRFPASESIFTEKYIQKTIENGRFLVVFDCQMSENPVKHFSLTPTQLPQDYLGTVPDYPMSIRYGCGDDS